MVEDIKKALHTINDAHKDLTVRYLGAGKYNLLVSSNNYQDAESELKEVLDSVKECFSKDSLSMVDFKRKEIAS